jgi:NAD(P)-dependent dehydrogenase (short-subunit alcohol dehydrogenase family)
VGDDEDSMELEGKVCLITGGSSGIGAATAREFACRGADIAICGLPSDDSLAQELKQEIERLGHHSRCFDPNESVRCVQQTLATFGYLDVLVHCAGGPANGGLLDVDPCTWYRAFDIHVHAVFHLGRRSLRWWSAAAAPFY